MKTFTCLFIFISILAHESGAQNVNTASSKELVSLSQGETSKGASGEAILWEFQSPPSYDSNAPECNGIDKDALGDEIACLKFMVDKRYVEKEEVVPGDPTVRTKVHKPDVYKAIRNIDKHYRKAYSDETSKNQIAENYKHILRVSLAVLYTQDTSEFEKALNQEKKNTVNQIRVFNRVKLL